MNTKNKITRFVLALMLALGAVGISTSAALAAPPLKYEITADFSFELPDVCPFPINIHAIVTGTEIVFFDKNGAVTRINDTYNEQDTFTANGKTLVSIPYTYSAEWLFDNSGNLTHVYVNGVAVKVPLPDGGLFIAAGRSDFMAHPGEPGILIPDHGNAVNLDGFCAALAP